MQERMTHGLRMPPWLGGTTLISRSVNVCRVSGLTGAGISTRRTAKDVDEFCIENFLETAHRRGGKLNLRK